MTRLQRPPAAEGSGCGCSEKCREFQAHERPLGAHEQGRSAHLRQPRVPSLCHRRPRKWGGATQLPQPRRAPPWGPGRGSVPHPVWSQDFFTFKTIEGLEELLWLGVLSTNIDIFEIIYSKFNFNNNQSTRAFGHHYLQKSHV